jgi:sigma-B regulation protein RsbU (phosphoserine phosphatase)
MSHLRASFHAEARAGSSASAIVQAMHESLSRATETGRFATFFLALISRREHRLWFCNAGHNPPLLVRGGALQTLDGTGLPLAMIDFGTYEEAVRPFGPGDLLILYSDGVTEAQNRQDQYGEERLRARVLTLAAGSAGAAQIGEALLADVSAFTRGAPAADDVTIVVVRRLDAGMPAGE